MEDKLILLKRANRYNALIYEYEIHMNNIEQDKNLIFITKDEEFARKLVERYNNYEK